MVVHYTSLSAIDQSPAHQAGVILIGNFDGVHLGHQEMIARAKTYASAHNLPLGVLTFEPHPRQLFRPDDKPFRITPLPLKLQYLSGHGIDFAVSLPFDWAFASQSADDFIHHVLDQALRPAHIFIGYDFHFGQMRQGGAEDLKKAGYGVGVIDEISDQNSGQSYSSSHIRTALRQGRIDAANQQLGWQWYIQGTVFQGDQRGRELGYPTANIRLDDTIHPAYGVYSSFVKILADKNLPNDTDSQWFPAATNIGIRPMFAVPTGQVEAHILDFDRDIYGREIAVRPVKLLRGEAKFNSLDALIAQIEADCSQVRRDLIG